MVTYRSMAESSTDSPRTRSEVDRAYDDLRRAIISCELLPGEQITEIGMAERLGAGRAAVRVALQRLHQERLVQVVPRRGYLVAPVTIKRTRELYDVRFLIEPEAVRLAATRITDAELDWLASIGDDKPYHPGDRESILKNFLPTNRQFHLAIARLSGNDVMVELLTELFAELDRIFHIGLMLATSAEGMYHDHVDLLPFLAARDADGAADLTRRQIASGRDSMIAALALSPSVASIAVAPAGS